MELAAGEGREDDWEVLERDDDGLGLGFSLRAEEDADLDLTRGVVSVRRATYAA